MKNITVNQAINIMQEGKFFGLRGYAKKDGSLRNFNGLCGVKKYSNGGSWNGNANKNILIAEPVSNKTKKQAENSNLKINPYRTLILDSFIGCELRANGQVFKIVK